MANKKVMLYIGFIILGFIALSIIGSLFYTVQENEYALVVRFSRVEREVDSPGLHFKVPVIDDVMYFPKTKLFYEITQSDVFTADAKAMTADCFIIWEISKPLLFYQRLRTVTAAEARLEAISYNAMQTIVSTFEQSDIIGSEEEADITDITDIEDLEDLESMIADERSREYLNTLVTGMAQTNAEGLGVRIVDVKIKSFELAHDNEQAVFQRMISERDRFARYERAEGVKEADIIKNEVDREANITVSDARARAEEIIAQGESEYMRLLAESYRGPGREDFYSFMRGLDAAKASVTGSEKTLILDKDSLLARILIGP
ncbi:MAG: protease modulator HflC [Oscillospiraceae bacterium]|nr:protease modulator HflC [Oscillospiraceae bacterium]